MKAKRNILSGSLISVKRKEKKLHIYSFLKFKWVYTNISLHQDVLPRQFSTPMFWKESNLKELEGTDIVCK